MMTIVPMAMIVVVSIVAVMMPAVARRVRMLAGKKLRIDIKDRVQVNPRTSSTSAIATSPKLTGLIGARGFMWTRRSLSD